MKISLKFRNNFIKRMFSETSKKTISEENRIRGGLYGSLIGDTVGSTIEFKMNITEYMIKSSLKFEGSRIFNYYS
jgi:hypothetical protein